MNETEQQLQQDIERAQSAVENIVGELCRLHDSFLSKLRAELALLPRPSRLVVLECRDDSVNLPGHSGGHSQHILAQVAAFAATAYPTPELPRTYGGTLEPCV